MASYGNGCENPCPSGTFASSIAKRIGEGSCTDCPKGTYCTGSKSVEAIPCPTGFYCENDEYGVIYPKPCKAGSYGDVLGLKTEACSGQCPTGSMCTVQTTSPVQCQAGTFADGTGSSSCKDWCVSFTFFFLPFNT